MFTNGDRVYHLRKRKYGYVSQTSGFLEWVGVTLDDGTFHWYLPDSLTHV